MKTMYTRLFILLFLLFCTKNIRAQSIELEHFIDISTVQKIAVHSNNIWLQTLYGISQLDTAGRLIKNFNLLDGVSNWDELLQGEDAEPFLHSREQKALLRWNAAQKKWTVFHPLKGEEAEDYDIYNENNQIWLLEKEAFQLLKNGKWQRYPYPKKSSTELPYANFLAQSKSGKVYYIASKSEAAVYDGKVWTSFQENTTDRASYFLQGDTLCEGKTGEFWDGSKWTKRVEAQASSAFFLQAYPQKVADIFWDYNEKKGLTSYQNGQIKNYSDLPLDKTKQLYCIDEKIKRICADERGRLYFASNFGNIYWQEGEAWRRIAIENPHYLGGTLHIKDDFLEDTQGRIWLAGERGVSVYAQGRWQAQPCSLFMDFSTKRITPVLEILQSASGKIYINTNQGLYQQQNNGKWEFLMQEDASYAYLHEQGHISVLSAAGKHYEFFDDGSVFMRYLPDMLVPKDFFRLQAAQSTAKGECWLTFSFHNSFIRYKNGKIKHYSPLGASNLFTCDDWYFAQAGDSAVFAFCCYQDLIMLPPNSEKWQTLSTTSSQHHLQVDAQGAFWYYDEEGLHRYYKGNWEKKAEWIKPNEKMESFFVDSRQRLWLMTSHQLFVRDLQTNKNIASIRLPQSTKAQKIYEDKAGNIWFVSTLLGVLRASLR